MKYPPQTAQIITDQEKDRLVKVNQQLLEACRAAIKYDEAIQTCANNPEKMASFCTAQDDDLDNLYDDWLSKARVAIKAAEQMQER